MTMITIFAALLLLIGTANATEWDSWPSFPNEGRFLEEGNDQFIDPFLNENDDLNPVLDTSGSYGSYDDDATTEAATTESSGDDNGSGEKDVGFDGEAVLAFQGLSTKCMECGTKENVVFEPLAVTAMCTSLNVKNDGYITIDNDCTADSLLRRGRSLGEIKVTFKIAIPAGKFKTEVGGAAALVTKLDTLKVSVTAQTAFLGDVQQRYGEEIIAAEEAAVATGNNDLRLTPLVEVPGGTLTVASFAFVDETEYAAAPVPKSSDSGLSGGAIAGIVIACVVAVAAIVGAVVFVNTQETAASSGAGDGGGDDVFATTDKKSCQNDL